jgi:hypothetical protein
VSNDAAEPHELYVRTVFVSRQAPAAHARVPHQHPQRERFVKPPADAGLQRLQAPVSRRRQLVQMLTSDKRRKRIAHAAAHPSIERTIEFLGKEPVDTDCDVAGHVHSITPRWPKRCAACRASVQPAWRCCQPGGPNRASSTGDASPLPSGWRR